MCTQANRTHTIRKNKEKPSKNNTWTSSLEVAHVTMEDRGMYRCTAQVDKTRKHSSSRVLVYGEWIDASNRTELRQIIFEMMLRTSVC